MRYLKIFVWFIIPSLVFGSWQTQTEDEALFLRRIADFWEEGEYLVAKTQIEEFLLIYPNSAFGDTLRSALGDLLLRGKDYPEALNRYSKITTPELVNRSFLNRMQCLYHLGWYATLADESEKFLKEEKPVDAQQKLQTTYFLAIALYQQCLNAAKEPEVLTHLADRARPYFQFLFESELSSEVAQAFAHLCCILKDYPKAAKIIFDQAQKMPDAQEELLFQAALIEAEFDKERAIQTFSKIAKTGKAKAKDAAYNCLVLSFDAGHFDQLVIEKEAYLKNIPEERLALAHLFLGRSFLALKKYEEAVFSLKAYLKTAQEFERAAFLSLLEAAFQSKDLFSFEEGFEQFKDHFPQDPELASAYFSHAQLLKKMEKYEESRKALQTLSATFPEFAQKEELSFELIQIEYQTKNWSSCHEKAVEFLDRHGSKNELAAYAWRYLIFSLVELKAYDDLIEQLKILVKNETLFSKTERADWQFLLAKTYFEKQNYFESIQLLESILNENSVFPQRANAKLLLAYCYRDSAHDLVQFCTLCEEAFQEKANLVELGPLHASVFNAYLERSLENKSFLAQAEEHLYQAFLEKANVELPNLLWLADRYSDNHLERAAFILDHCIQKSSENPPKVLEPLIYKRAKIYQQMGKPDRAVELLETLMSQYKEHSIDWTYEPQVHLLLAESFIALKNEEKALFLLDEILTHSSNLKDETSATACLLRARLKIAKDQYHPAIVELKNLILQRSLAHEPIHLEAALDYVALITDLEEPQKRLAKQLNLLVKTKNDFESTGDLLAKDYQESRSKLPEKNLIFEGYIRLMEAQILLTESKIDPDTQNQLQAKAKQLLLQIIDEAVHPLLVERSRLQLEQANASDVSSSKSQT